MTKSSTYGSYWATGEPWCPLLPCSWQLKQVRHLGVIHNGGTPTADESHWGGEIPFVTPPDIRLLRGAPILGTERTLTEAGLAAGSNLVPSGSVLASIRAPIGHVGRNYFPVALNQGCRGVTPHTEYASEFMAYAFQAARGELDARGRGTTFTEISASQFASIKLPAPSLEVQREIVHFLDGEAAKIDALIAKQEKLIDLLQQRRKSQLLHALTRGLDEEPMRPSNVRWIGDMPKHWITTQIKWLTPVRRGASPRPIEDPDYFDADGEWAWTRIADVTAARGRLTQTTQRLSSLGSSRSVKLTPGSLFVSVAATVGKPCITEIKACIHDGFVYFPRLKLNPMWLYRLFEAGECYVGLGKLGTQLNLNTDTIGSISIPIPPAEEIERILTYLDRNLAQIDSVIAKTKRFIELSKERRTALITSAVTGQIDVRGATA